MWCDAGAGAGAVAGTGAGASVCVFGLDWFGVVCVGVSILFVVSLWLLLGVG